MADIKLYYFDSRAKGEFIRLLLRAAGQKFEDVFVNRDTWQTEGKAETPYGQLPYMIYNGKKYGQSIAIGTFLAKTFGFYGESDEDGLREAEVVQLCDDFRNNFFDWYFCPDEDKKASFLEKLKDELIPRYLGYFEILLIDNSATGFFVGDSVTLADLVIYDVLDTVLGIEPEALSTLPNLQKLRNNVKALPALKDYLDKRPKTVI